MRGTLRLVSSLFFAPPALFAARPTEAPSPIIAVAPPDTGIPGYAFPEAEATLAARIDALSEVPASADSTAAFQSLYLHAWGLWTSITAYTQQTYEGQRLRVFETWSTPGDLRSGASHARWRRGLTDLGQIRAHRSAARGAGRAQEFADRLAGFVKFDPVAAGHVLGQRLLQSEALQALLSSGAQQIPAFPSASLVSKSVYKIIDSASLAGGRYFRLPAWTGPPTDPQPWGPERWPGCVWVDLLGGRGGAGGIDWVGAADGSSRTEATTYALSDFIHIALSADDAAALNSERPGTNAQAGDIALLVGMHVAGRETARWTWQTFWWDPQPDNPPFPSSAAIGALRPAELTGAPRHYALALSYTMQAPNQPVVGGDNSGRAIYAYNPWIEAAFTPSELPDSIPGFDPNGLPAANNLGVQTNCMSCHAGATFNPGNLATAPRLSGARYVDLMDPRFVGTLQTDFLWSVANDAK